MCNNDKEPKCCCAMGKNKDEEMLRVLLAHWIEHNNSHEEGFREWADKAEKLGKSEVSELIAKAANYLKSASDTLLEAKKHM